MHETHPSDAIPVSCSVVGGIYDTDPEPHHIDWRGFRRLLAENVFDLSSIEHKACVGAVTCALLLGGKKIEHVVSADIVGFDSDRPYVPLEFFIEQARASGEALFLHTTISHSAAAPRCRVFQPLSRRLTGNAEYRALWEARYRALKAEYEMSYGNDSRCVALRHAYEERNGAGPSAMILDEKPRNANSLFFFPSHLAGSKIRIEPVAGAPVDVDRYLAEFPAPTPSASSTARPVPAKAPSRRASRGLIHLSLTQSTLVKQEVIDEYHAAGEGNFHHAFYRALCRIAARAKATGFPLDAGLLTQIARELDAVNGPFYDERRYCADAASALRWVGI